MTNANITVTETTEAINIDIVPAADLEVTKPSYMARANAAVHAAKRKVGDFVSRVLAAISRGWNYGLNKAKDLGGKIVPGAATYYRKTVDACLTGWGWTKTQIAKAWAAGIVVAIEISNYTVLFVGGYAALIALNAGVVATVYAGVALAFGLAAIVSFLCGSEKLRTMAFDYMWQPATEPVAEPAAA